MWQPDPAIQALLAELPARIGQVIRRPLLQGATTTAAALMQHASAQLTAYERPSEIIILPSLPASSTGKILKHRLAQTASGQAPE